jgi:hypothetical protein
VRSNSALRKKDGTIVEFESCWSAVAMLGSVGSGYEIVIPEPVCAVEIRSQNCHSLIALGSNVDESNDKCPKGKQERNQDNEFRRKVDFAINRVAHFEI